MHSATRYHDISCGHRVVGHEGKCQHLHGHNYRIHFTCQSALEAKDFPRDRDLDSVGRVVDFGVMKDRLCMWLENNWDHRFLVAVQDPQADDLIKLDPTVVMVPFNPTAENMARFLVECIAPVMLQGTGVRCVKVEIEETRKCSASYEVTR